MKNKLFASALCAAALFTTNAMAKDQELYFYNWSEYIPSEVLEDFTKETGIKVIYSTYESNESMYAKLKTQGAGYDLVVPSTYFVSKMRKEGMLQEIDHSKLSHFKDLIQTISTSLLIQAINSLSLISGERRVSALTPICWIKNHSKTGAICGMPNGQVN